jgi:hypothetical protein
MARIGAGAMVGVAPGALRSATATTRFGVNIYDLFIDSLRPGGRVGTAKLETLGRLGIPFVRFPVSGQVAGDWARFEADPAAWWSTMDRVVAAAAASGVRLVPCILWNPVSLAYHCGEPMQALVDPTSRTSTLANRYTTEFVTRYDGSRTILFYEFANELNDWVDLPNVLSFWPKPDPTMPGRGRMQTDKLSGVDLAEIALRFATTVRRLSRRPVSMGTNSPRPNAWHLATGSFATDTANQYGAHLNVQTPSAFDVLGIHLYPQQLTGRQANFASYDALVAAFVRAARASRRISFIGEFGVPRMVDRNAEQRTFAQMLSAISRGGVRYAAIWDYDRRIPDPEWTVTPGNDRRYQLDAIVAVNRGA